MLLNKKKKIIKGLCFVLFCLFSMEKYNAYDMNGIDDD